MDSQRGTGLRLISPLTATCIVVANMIGTGVFTSLGFQVTGLPSAFAIMVLWGTGGVCALCGALAYAELASALPRSGGEYHFLSQIYHPAVGFLAGWISATVGFAAPVALAAMAFGTYLNGLFPGVAPLALSVGVVVAVTLIHLGTLRLSSIFQDTATSLKIILIVVLIVLGFSLVGRSQASFLPHTRDTGLITGNSFAVSLVYVMYAYSGWNACVYILGEMRDPARTAPIALLVGTVFVTALYMALNAMFLYVAPLTELAGRIDVGHVAATRIFGVIGGDIMSGLIGLGLVSAVSAMTWIGPRVSMTMGEDCRALRFLAKRCPQGSPRVALIVQSAIVILLLLTSTFDAVLTYIQFSLTLMSFLAVLGVIVLRVRHPELPRPCRMWGYPFTALIFLGITAWMMWHILADRPMESLAGLATLAVGLAVYFISPTHPIAMSNQPNPNPKLT
ncbi:MAG: amino acid permease [Methylacidiphilales bacterium]|nr:amino acid permease [Candidatus Methylacidiphilales bacterium]